MMADGADGFLDLTVAINKVSVLPNPMTKDHAQKLIDRLENTKWILVVRFFATCCDSLIRSLFCGNFRVVTNFIVVRVVFSEQQ